jgi:hypothetical protein
MQTRHGGQPLLGQPLAGVDIALGRDGYALVKCEHAVFNPEV